MAEAEGELERWPMSGPEQRRRALVEPALNLALLRAPA